MNANWPNTNSSDMNTPDPNMQTSDTPDPNTQNSATPHPERKTPLGQLTAVIVVIAILYAVIAASGVHHAPMRSAVSRVRTDMRIIATALETYYVDNHAYPAMHSFDASTYDIGPIRKLGGAGLSFTEPGGSGVAGLTTPVAYVTNLFPDPFAPIKGMPFAYWTPADARAASRAEVTPEDSATTGGWILISPGPDYEYNLTPDDLPNVYDPVHSHQPSAVLLAGGGARGAYTYDPTNGTVSIGDLWRVKQ